MGPSSADHLRVAFCDDALGFPMLLEAWLNDLGDVDRVAQATSIDGLLSALVESRAQVVLVDLMLGIGRISAETVLRLRQVEPAAAIVLMSSLPVSALQEDARAVGADLIWAKASGLEGLREVLADARTTLRTAQLRASDVG